MKCFACLCPRPSKLAEIYFSKQFLLYIICGILASVAHIVARLAISLYTSFPVAVFLSYFVGMPVAFFLYRNFVFTSNGAVSREVALFSLTYFGFLPLTWILAVGFEPALSLVLPKALAELAAHIVGIVIPVLLNFAYNKFVTFRR